MKISPLWLVLWIFLTVLASFGLFWVLIQVLKEV